MPDPNLYYNKEEKITAVDWI